MVTHPENLEIDCCAVSSGCSAYPAACDPAYPVIGLKLDVA